MTDEQRIALYNAIRDIIADSSIRISAFTHRGEGPANEPFLAHAREQKIAAMAEITDFFETMFREEDE